MISVSFAKAAVVLGLAAATGFSPPATALDISTGSPVARQTAQLQDAIVEYSGQDGDVSALNQAIRTMSAGKPLFVMYFATWCQPCTDMAGDFKSLAGSRPGNFQVLKVDIDRYPELSSAAGVRGTPSVDVFLNSQKANPRLPGRMPIQMLNSILNRLAPARAPAPHGQYL